MKQKDSHMFFFLSTHNSPAVLYCRNGGYHLRIQPNGTVDASRQENDVYSKYVMLNDECYFIEKIEENHYNTYRSQRYQENGDWYVGIKKNGWAKNGSKTHKGQNAIYFLPIPVDNSIQ
uniref:Fibroblast growth factor 1b n=1 Tax=Sinocyclocheilus rhinocerous TaxID=307959 RepID=A0A673LZQ6_9TELE